MTTAMEQLKMNPYEADPAKIPPSDRYAEEPYYGRYLPRADDFQPDPAHINSSSGESLRYWEEKVLGSCDASNRVYENTGGGRDVFALGGVIVKSSHLRSDLSKGGRRSTRDYSYADKNEIRAVELAREALSGIKIPVIYFADKVCNIYIYIYIYKRYPRRHLGGRKSPCGHARLTDIGMRRQINGRDVLVQERVAGVGLNVAWQYISQPAKDSFKQQARDILQQMRKIQPPSPSQEVTTTTGRRSYVFPDPDPVEHKGIQQLESDIIFSESNTDGDLSFMHNDFTQSNCIVDQGKIVGLVDWEMAGFFGWKTAGEVHVKIRGPKRENFAQLNLPEEQLSDILFWNDLYCYSRDSD